MGSHDRSNHEETRRVKKENEEDDLFSYDSMIISYVYSLKERKTWLQLIIKKKQLLRIRWRKVRTANNFLLVLKIKKTLSFQFIAIRQRFFA